jgi:uncharacterized protein (TIGR02001 family)
MKLTHGLAAAALSLTALAANAEITGTLSVVSDYNFRGISLSANDPALQGSLDYASENGFYAGAWASTIDYGDDYDGNVEVDLYAGFAGEFAEDFGYDVGLVLYTYPDSSGDRFDGTDEIHTYPEIYAGLSYKWIEVKQWYTNDYSGTGDDAYYTEGNATFELPANFGLTAHLGYNYGDAFDDTEYMDYSIGVTYTVANFDLGLGYADTDLDDGEALFSSDDVFNSEGRVMLSVSTTFPWSAE